MRVYLEELIKHTNDLLNIKNRIEGSYNETRVSYLSNEQPSIHGRTWVVEIKIDDLTVYKDSYLITDNEYPVDLLEDDMCDRAIKSAFVYGLKNMEGIILSHS